MKHVCVFCGSKPGARPVYEETAVELGRLLVQRGLTLVYGGATPGLMGTIADTVLAASGRVIGVIPGRMADREIAHTGLTELHVVDSMRERKALMMKLSDAFIALPGGYGTLDEIAEVATWSQLGFHQKPCGLLNVAGFFDPLLTYLDRAVAEGFLKQAHRELIIHAEEPAALLDQLAAHTGSG